MGQFFVPLNVDLGPSHNHCGKKWLINANDRYYCKYPVIIITVNEQTDTTTIYNNNNNQKKNEPAGHNHKRGFIHNYP